MPCRNYECRRIIAEQQAMIEALRRTAAATPSPQADKARVPDGLIEALRNQRQVDEEGIECGVSRQAVDEAIEILESLTVPADKARGDGLDYVPGELDRTAPARIWLQIDTSGDNAERDEAWPGADHVTWQDEEIGGLEIAYVRADLATPQPQGDASRESDLVRMVATNIRANLDSLPSIAKDWADKLDQVATPQARPDGDLYDTIFAAVKKGCPKCGDAHDNPERPVLNFRELEAIAGAVFAAVFPLVQARPDGGAVAWMADDGSTVSEYARAAHPSPTAFAEYTTPLYTHPDPAPDVELWKIEPEGDTCLVEHPRWGRHVFHAPFTAAQPKDSEQARPDGGVKVPERCDHGRTMDEACDNYGCDREAHPAPAPDVARLVELLNAIDADVLAAEQIGERVTHDDIRTCVSQLRAAAQQGATNGQE